MARPKNDHHVHSDGYRSEKGEPDPMRMVEEMADEIEAQLDVDAYPDSDFDGPYIEVEFRDDVDVRDRVETIVQRWDSNVVVEAEDYLEVRP